MNELASLVQELLQSWAPVRVRPMFGGCGLFRDDLMFAIISDDELFLKADAHSEPDFEGYGLQPFVYHKQGKPVTMSFRQAPAELFDDPEVAMDWAQRAWEAALRSRKARPR